MTPLPTLAALALLGALLLVPAAAAGYPGDPTVTVRADDGSREGRFPFKTSDYLEKTMTASPALPDQATEVTVWIYGATVTCSPGWPGPGAVYVSINGYEVGQIYDLCTSFGSSYSWVGFTFALDRQGVLQGSTVVVRLDYYGQATNEVDIGHDASGPSDTAGTTGGTYISGKAMLYVTASLGRPSACFSVQGTGSTGASADASCSWDYRTPASSLQVRWDWGDGSSWTPWTTAKTASHTYPSGNGINTKTYTVTLTVLDGDGFAARVSHDVTVGGLDLAALADTAGRYVDVRAPATPPSVGICTFATGCTDPAAFLLAPVSPLVAPILPRVEVD